MSWLVVTMFSSFDSDQQLSLSQSNVLIQRADTEEQALKYAHDRACAFTSEFCSSESALPNFQQSGTYSESNVNCTIGVVVVRPEACTAEVTCDGDDGSFNVLVDNVNVMAAPADSC